ncbi:MAG: PAC2 family protein [Acidimicrobiales bacterium]
MSAVEWQQRPTLTSPILVVAFEGWFDAGEAATGAVRWVSQNYNAELAARIDPEPYYNFQQARPRVRFDSKGERVIEWPSNDCSAVHLEGQSHDLAMIAGVEPHLRWRAFAADLIELARGFSAEMVVTLGSLIDRVPHTRQPPVKGSSTNDELAHRLGLDRPTYQGPTGIVGVLHDALDKESLPVISLRVAIPHYVSGTPNPKATKALLAYFEQVTGVTTHHAKLDHAAVEWERRVDEAVASDDDVQSYVRRVEEEVDRQAEQEIPSGDALAAEFEKFLREQRGED